MQYSGVTDNWRIASTADCRAWSFQTAVREQRWRVRLFGAFPL